MVERRQIRVLLPYSKSYFYVDKGEIKGLNQELLTRFGAFLNKQEKGKKAGPAGRIRVILIPTPRDLLLTRLVEGRGDLALGNLTITPARLEKVDFSDPLLKDVKEYVVTPASVPDIASADGLSGNTVHVRTASSYRESLDILNRQLKAAGKPPVTLVETDPLLEDEDLLEMVNAEGLPAIVVDSHKARFWAQVFDNIKVHDNAPLREGGEIAWAFRKNSPELAERVNAFVKTIGVGSKTGNILFATFLKQQAWLKRLNNEEDRKRFWELLALFQKYGNQYDINWLILAGKAYQESRFRQDARGPTGAVGVMQIKPATAAGKDVGIANVATNVDNNIHAGTKYIRFLLDRYYADLASDPFNQTLIGFAGYNAGPNRIKRLREIARERGLDDTKWFDNLEWVVAEQIGAVTVNYVRNIFEYLLIYSQVYERHQAMDKLKEK
jgi:membrane-bound lytic murein transglycosylase MltF